LSVDDLVVLLFVQALCTTLVEYFSSSPTANAVQVMIFLGTKSKLQYCMKLVIVMYGEHWLNVRVLMVAFALPAL
jgi:hypothetical protein